MHKSTDVQCYFYSRLSVNANNFDHLPLINGSDRTYGTDRLGLGLVVETAGLLSAETADGLEVTDFLSLSNAFLFAV